MKTKSSNRGLQQGWWAGAVRLLSPNQGERPPGAVVDLIVLHSISLPPGEFGGQNVQDLFMNRLDWSRHAYFETIRGLEVSAHFYIERSGLVWQFVSTEARAWHAGQSSFQGRDNCNDYSIGIELEGLEGADFALPQYRSLAALCLELKEHYPIAHVAGHEHIAPGRKFDPGAGFDWKKLQRDVGWPKAFFPALACFDLG